jgi:hypothetical protein
MPSSSALRDLLTRLWHSPTGMTWALTVLRMSTMALVLVGVLSQFTPEAANVWLLFLAIVGLQGVADSGFSQTFTRVFAFAKGGATKTQLRDLRTVTTRESKDVDSATISAIRGTARTVHRRLAGIWTLILLVAGTLALRDSLNLIAAPQDAWLAWAIVAVVSVVWVYCAQFAAMLRGIEEVALQQRIGCATSLGQLISSLLVLGFGGGLLALTIAYNSWFVAQAIISASYANRRVTGTAEHVSKGHYDPIVFGSVWPSAWRSGLGVLMGFGVLQVSGIAYAQLASPGESAAYLLALRVLSSIIQIGHAPFYAKLPQLARMRAAGQLAEQRRVAKSAMRLSYWVIVLGLVVTPIAIGPLLQLLNSETRFVNENVWLLLAGGAIMERYGAMHLQLYSTTNHILWHWINGITGLIFISFSVGTYSFLQEYSFPAAFFLSNIGFYGWYSARLSYGALNVSLWQFERDTLALPIVVFVAGLIVVSVF